MIVITTIEDIGRRVLDRSDILKLTITTTYNFDKYVITKYITEDTVIDTVILYHIASEDGTCISQTLSSVYGLNGQFPKEITEAVHVDELPIEQKNNFLFSLKR